MQQTEHLATARDDTRIHWTSAGAGSPTAVLCDGIGCAGYIWRFLAPELARRHRVIHWNYRGHGRSERPTDPARATLADCVDDLLAVLDAAGERRVVLVGHSMGVQVALEAHRRVPERIAGLILVCGSAGRPLDTVHDLPLLAAAFPHARALVERLPGVARILFRTLIPTRASLEAALLLEVNRKLVAREDLIRYLEDLADVDAPLFVRLLESAAATDASDHLPAVAVPTLILAGEDDTFTPMWLSVKMHAAIPGSELLVLPGGTHVGPLEHPELCALRTEKFFAEHFGGAGHTAPGAVPPAGPGR